MYVRTRDTGNIFLSHKYYIKGLFCLLEVPVGRNCSGQRRRHVVNAPDINMYPWPFPLEPMLSPWIRSKRCTILRRLLRNEEWRLAVNRSPAVSKQKRRSLFISPFYQLNFLLFSFSSPSAFPSLAPVVSSVEPDWNTCG